MTGEAAAFRYAGDGGRHKEKSGVSSKEHRIFISSGEVSPDIKAPEGDMRRFGYEN